VVGPGSDLQGFDPGYFRASITVRRPSRPPFGIAAPVSVERATCQKTWFRHLMHGCTSALRRRIAASKILVDDTKICVYLDLHIELFCLFDSPFEIRKTPPGATAEMTHE
jgi:hypothetical protein